MTKGSIEVTRGWAESNKRVLRGKTPIKVYSYKNNVPSKSKTAYL